MKHLITALLMLLIPACSSIQHYQYSSHSYGVLHQAFIGEELYRIHRERDLPNVFGRADVWGGKVNEGMSELRFMGLTDEGEIIFGVTEIDILSNESVFTRYGVGQSNTTINPQGTQAVTTHIPAPEADVMHLPSTVQITFDPAREVLILRDVSVEIVEVQDSMVSYILHEN